MLYTGILSMTNSLDDVKIGSYRHLYGIFDSNVFADVDVCNMVRTVSIGCVIGLLVYMAVLS